MSDIRPSKETICNKLVKSIDDERDAIISYRDLAQDIAIVEGTTESTTIENIRKIIKDQENHREIFSKIYTDVQCPAIIFKSKERARQK